MSASGISESSPSSRTLLLMLLAAAVVTGLVLLGLYMYGTFPALSEGDADKQCVQCLVSNCPPDKASINSPDQTKVCKALKDAQACGCSGACARLCRQSINYNPSRCTESPCIQIPDLSNLFPK
jgi:hypothetical protein